MSRPTGKQMETRNTKSSAVNICSFVLGCHFSLTFGIYPPFMPVCPLAHRLGTWLSPARLMSSSRSLNPELTEQRAYSSWQQCPAQTLLVLVPWSSQQPWGWSFLSLVYLAFLQYLWAALCHSNKFLFYHCVSLNHSCCLPSKNPGEVSGIHTIVWQQNWWVSNELPQPRSLRLACEDRGTPGGQIQASKCTWVKTW